MRAGPRGGEDGGKDEVVVRGEKVETVIGLT